MLNTKFHVLQMTAFTFLPAMCVAIKMEYWVGAVVYLTNFLITIYSHRIIRDNKYDYGDIVDLCAIGLWIFFNLGVVIDVCRYISLHPCQYLHGLFVIFTCMCAIICWRLNVKKNQFQYRSRRRNYYHGLMHCFGGLGSLILMMVVNNTLTSL